MRTLLSLLLLTTTANGQTLLDTLRARIANFPGTVSLYAKNLDTGVAVGINETDPVRTASTIKLPILLAVFDAVSRGDAKWSEMIPITTADTVSGSGVLSEFTTGVQLPLRDVVHLMIVVSDNTATNLVIERFSADAVNAYLDKLSIKTTRSMRKVLGEGEPKGFSAAGKLPGNKKYGLGVSTPKDMVTILEKLEHGEIVSAAASKEMIAIMKGCQDNTGIRRRLGDATIANKSGSLDALRSDVGIVYSPGGRIAMALTVDGMKTIDNSPDNIGSLLIADLARMLVDGMAK